MKAIFASLLLASLASSPALAKPSRPAPAPAKKAVVDEVSKLNLGLAYGLKKRTNALPETDAETFEAKRLNENQVGAIVRERAEDLEYCWLRLPPAKRVVSAAILHLSIEASGKVAAVEVNGDLPAGVGKCITQMAGRWAFPAADAASEIDHGIMLTTTSQKVR
jgi:hypothetical protein